MGGAVAGCGKRITADKPRFLGGKTRLVAQVGPRYHPRMVRPLPHTVRCSLCRSRGLAGLWLAVAAVAVSWTLGPAGAQDAGLIERPVTIRVTWGGGKAHAWSGSIRLMPAEGMVNSAADLEWQTLCADADAAATVHAVDGTIFVHEPSRRSSNGVELSIPRWQGARIAVRLVADEDERTVSTFEVPVADLLMEPRQQPLDRDGNRLILKPAPGDALRVVCVPLAAGAAHASSTTSLFRPGEIVRVNVDPLLPKRSPGSSAVELRMRIKSAADAEPTAAQSLLLVEANAVAASAAAEPRLQRYERCSFEIPLPAREGAYDIELEAVERGGLRWSRPLATRTVQVLAVADLAPDATASAADRGEGWKVIHELDPGSPRLHERLRRLPGVGKSYVPMPAMPMPSMSMPSMALPNVSLPNVPIPSVPMPKLPIPAVSLPSVSSVTSMVPRLSGLLAAGHSTVEVHALGPMLRLPSARSADEPAWEGIVIAGAQPGLPHLVEVEFPLDQRAVVGMTVLESDAAGASVEVRSSGGFEVTPPLASAAHAGPTGLGRHGFIFWPTTRNPLIVIANPSTHAEAVFGRVRVSAGPLRPPAKTAVAVGGSLTTAASRGRRVHAYVPTPDFSQFGASERPASGVGRPFADWNTFLSGASHAAEWFSAQGAAGAMVVVYRDGAATWPSRLTRGAPRWDSGATSDAGLDPVRKDLLGMLCRIHGREGLRLLPALSFNAPLPAVESLLVSGGAGAAGIACVGRDGKPKQTDGGRGCHYNALDPRVQQAVEDVVRELAGRIHGAETVDGLALVLPHDGWMHLPGTTWGLDDVTFSRFLAEVGGQEPATGGERFARRAALVEGPLREQWLEWRAASMARFHARLADVLTEHDPGWSLHVVPTSLFAEGELASRFRPSLAAEPADTDLLREIGLDPTRLTADRRIVFVSPHVHAAADTLLDRCIVDNANHSLAVARGVAGAARRGVIALEQPLPLSINPIVPHGPFSGVAAADEATIHAVAEGAARAKSLAESLVVSDVEVVFDMGLLFGRVEPAFERCLQAFAALPAGRLDLAESLAAPLVVRSRRDEGLTVVSVANAGPAPCRAGLALAGSASAVVDAVDGTRLPLDPTGGATVPLRPWEVRTLVLDGGVAVQGARVEFDDDVREAIAAQLADLNRRRAVLETPVPLDVLDNPGFELAGPGGAAADAGGRAPGGGVGGWELVEASRGAVAFVPGVNGAAGRGIGFSSVNGLSTVRSNPFPPPATGRVSVAVWLRIAEGDPQPPLRLALEGMQEGREYYRFAPVGGLAGGKPLAAGWSQFVLQVDDLPAHGLESLRVRFDLLGPGTVEIDGVRVFDLAFDESQRVQLSRRLSVMEQRLMASDLGSCLVELDTYWPRFLKEFVTDDAVAAVATARSDSLRGTESPVQPSPPAERSGSMFDRVRRWWQ